MSISTRCAEGLIWVYKGINRTGLLNASWARSLYISSYFTYKKYIEDAYARLIKHHAALFSDGNILDIGANIGYTAFVFSQAIEAPFKVFAFEPEERNIELLKQSSLKYGFSAQLVPIAAAVGDKEGEIELWKNEAHNGDHRILTSTLKEQLPDHVKIQKTPIVTVDNFIKKLGSDTPISFIKIDVQGYELAVCKGMIETLAQHPNTIIGFEYCPSIIEALGFQPEELLHFFKERGYQFYVLTHENKIQHYDIEQGQAQLRKIRPHDYIDILCASRDLTAEH